MFARIFKSRRGSTLLMVIIVFALLVIFATAALAIVSNSHLNSVTDYQSQQAYFTARSSVLAAVDYFKNNPSEDISNYVGTTPTTGNKINGMGEYKVVITDKGGNYYQIASTATFGDKTRTEKAIVKKEIINPFNGLATVTGAGGISTFSNDTVYLGDIYIGKDSGTFIFDSIRVFGNLYIDNEGKSAVQFNGKVIIKKDPSKTGERFNGALLISGDATIPDHSAPDVTVEGGLYIKGRRTGGIHIPSSDIHEGANCPSDISFTNNNAINTDIINSIDSKIATQTFSSYPSPAITVVANGKITIKGNLELNTTTAQTIASLNPNECVFDTSAGSIYVKIAPGTYTFEKIKKMSVTGNNQVFVYFNDKTSPVKATITNGGKCGDMSCVSATFFDTRGSNTWVPGTVNHAPRMSIFASNTASSISVLTGSSDLCAFIYMPNGKITIDQNANFAGSFVCSSVYVGTQCHLAHIPPDATTPPIPAGPSGGITLTGIYTNQ